MDNRNMAHNGYYILAARHAGSNAPVANGRGGRVGWPTDADLDQFWPSLRKCASSSRKSSDLGFSHVLRGWQKGGIVPVVKAIFLGSGVKRP